MNNLDEREAGMKFILNGRSFDTISSTKVAVSRGQVPQPPGWRHDSDVPEVRYERILFKTAKGAFFVHDHETTKYLKGKPVVSDAAYEKSPEEAMKWIENEGAMILDASGLPLPDEA